VVALLAVCLVAGAVVADNVYFVGDHDGVVSVYRGLPVKVGGLELNGLYLQTTTPLSSVAPSVLTRIERHDLHRKAAALALVHDAQGVLP
jgi:protein phosphatase